MTPATATGRFRVITGGGTRADHGESLAIPPAPRMGAGELAADMAELFALGLVQDLRAEAVVDPYCAVRVDGATRFTMHELLCELRNLSWFDNNPLGSLDNPASPGSRAGQGDAGHRRATRCNSDGQLTLQSLLRGGVALRVGGPLQSTAWASDYEAGIALDPVLTHPEESAPMSDWLGWCARQSGAGLRLPGTHLRPKLDLALGDRSEALHRTPPARPFHNAALVALETGAGMDDGLPEDGLWTGQRLLALMAQAERLARRIPMYRAGQPNRAPRPAVTAARMTVWLAREERQTDSNGALFREAADELAKAAPNLLHWVSRANRARRGPQRFDACLFLPLSGPDRQHLTPSDLASHAIVAGALATLIKAVCDTSRRAQLQMVGRRGPAQALTEQVDRLAADIGVLRSVSGGFFPAETHQDLRLGQAIALHLLRQTLEQDNRSAQLSVRDFDGQSLQITSHPRRFGRGHAELRNDGDPMDWPQEAGHPAAHLTAVV